MPEATSAPILVHWPAGPVLLSWQSGPCELPVTAAHAFCFAAGRVLVVEIAGRGWDIPGGHLEEGETPQDCLRRELWEEASARIERAAWVGQIVVDHSPNAAYSGGYPQLSAIAIFGVTVAALAPHVPTADSRGRALVERDALAQIHNRWNAVLAEGYRLARQEMAR